MKCFSLVKLLRATNAGSNDVSHTYELLVHTMSGKAETKADIKIHEMRRDYHKDLKMKGNKHAIRYLNTYTWECISEEEYEELVTEWNKE